MGSPRGDESLLARYLLGDLTEDEQVQVEDRAFADDHYLATLETVESDLIDAYVRGELNPTERMKFQSRFLPAPSRRRKVEFAYALATIVAEPHTTRPADAPRHSAWQSMVNLVRGWSPGLRLAAGMASLFCIIGVSWLVVEDAGMRSRMATLEAQHRDLQTREDTLRRQLGEEQGRAAALTAQLQKDAASVSARSFTVASLVLVPGLSRAESANEQLVLPPSAQLARIEIQLEPRDDFPRFRLELRTRGNEVLTQANVPRHGTGASAAVSFDVPASILVAGEYELTLEGVTNNGSAQNIGFYYFRVQKD